MRTFLLSLVVAAPVVAQPAKPAAPDFAHDVVPILKARCAKCHTNGTYKGGLSLDTRETLLKAKAAVPGKAAESEILKRVTSTDKDERMPPEGDRLTAKEVAVLTAWIDWLTYRIVLVQRGAALATSMQAPTVTA
ncbi:MAG TPA: c-type cytochrome domain-containing protein, partial [Gemmataceae bacterium]|nr:c-type cytochrome domain-containing protein [Gemmataceae bacterium]